MATDHLPAHHPAIRAMYNHEKLVKALEAARLRASADDSTQIDWDAYTDACKKVRASRQRLARRLTEDDLDAP